MNSGWNLTPNRTSAPTFSISSTRRGLLSLKSGSFDRRSTSSSCFFPFFNNKFSIYIVGVLVFIGRVFGLFLIYSCNISFRELKICLTLPFIREGCKKKFKIVEFTTKVGGWGQQWTDFPLIFFFFFFKYELKTLDVALGSF